MNKREVLQPLSFRTMLMTSAIHSRHYPAALRSGADVCTLDLEDTLPLVHRELCRDLFDAARLKCVRALRINSLRTPDGLRDILALAYGELKPDALLVPRVQCAHDLLILQDMLGEQLRNVALLATIDTVAGLAAVEEIAAATPRLAALVFGAADYAADAGLPLEWDQLLSARSRIVVAAKAAGIQAIDAPTLELEDKAALRADVDRSRALGFAGKAAIHPRQVPAINAGFTPCRPQWTAPDRIGRSHRWRDRTLRRDTLLVNAAAT